MASPRALEGLRVLDLSRVVAGPYATMLLADYGAEVIKIEHPRRGDGTRIWGPPWQGELSAYFIAVNRNKYSVAVDLSHPEGRRIVRELARQSDVLVENFRVGTMARWGLDYDSLRELNPRLIYCSVTGYGQTGPYRERGGYDFIIQAQGGIMSITGPPEGPPYKIGVAMIDVLTGLQAFGAILAALHYRERTGQGQYIDIAMLDVHIASLINVVQNYLVSGQPPRRLGNAHPNIVPYELFETADGYLALGAGTDEHFRRVCQVIGRPDLWEDPRFRTNPGRVQHREELIPQLQQAFRQHPTAYWMQRLVEAGVPASPVNDIPTVLQDPQVQARGLLHTVRHPTEGDITLVGPVARMTASPPQVYAPPPRLGEHTRQVLQERLGYTEAQLETLREAGVIAWP